MKRSYDEILDELFPRRRLRRAEPEVITLDDEPEVITLDDEQVGSGILDDVGEITWEQRQIRQNSRFINVIVRGLTFPHLENISEPLHDAIPRLFDEFLDSCLTASGVQNKDNALFCLAINHPVFVNSNIFVNFRRRSQIDGRAILNLINKVQQSYRDFPLFDSNLLVEMYIFDESPSGPNFLNGRGRVHTYFDEPLKIPGAVVNKDNLCLARSVIAGMLQADANEELDEAQKKILSNKRKHFLNRPSEQHLVLLRKLNIPTNLENYNLNHLKLIAAHYSEYRFILYTRPPGHRMYSIHTILNENAQKIVTLGYNDNHFDNILITPRAKIFNGIICHDCKLLYKTFEHRCKAKCSRCHSFGCKTGILNRLDLHCELCNVKFSSQECFDRHTEQICRTFKKCRDCLKYHKIITTRPHECRKQFCKLCMQHVEKEHMCCWTPPNKDKHSKCLERQTKYSIVFFDFETVVLANGEDVHNFANEQWPNLVAYSRFCQLCLNASSCAVCGSRDGYFRYQPNDEIWSLTDRFLDWILNEPVNNNALFIAHNGSRFDVHFLVRRLVVRGIYPKLILNGSQIVRLEIVPMRGETFNTVVFKDSYLLVPLPLAALPSAFGVSDISKGEFPYLFNHPINYGKILPTLPAKKFYCVARKKQAALQKFEKWYEERFPHPFNFDDELLEYCRMDVRILAECMKKYMVLATETTGWNPIIHCHTFASFSLFQLKMNHLQPNQVGVLPESGYYSGQKQSVIAAKYIRWLEHTLGHALQHKLNGGEHVVEVGVHKYLLDAFDKDANTAYEINGCFWHGCPKCTDKDSISSHNGERMSKAYDATLKREQDIKSTGINVITIWEHDIAALRRQNKFMDQFMKTTHVVTRLAPRDAFLGGRTQTYQLYAEAGDNKSLQYVDFCSLYPYVTAFDAEYPVGVPTVITADFESFECDCPYRGLIKCDVLPPKALLFPVIGTRVRGKLIFTNCRTCAQNAENGDCNHSDVARQLHTTITHVELKCAIARGYKVLKVYEVWSWSDWQQGGLFRDFVKKYIKIKQEASGWPRSDMTEPDKEKFLEEHMKHVGVGLDPSNIKENVAMRSIAKLQLNSVWGKMGQRPDKKQTVIHHIDAPELGKLITDPDKVLTSFKILENIVYCSWMTEDSHVETVPYTNVAIAAYTTAHARLMLYDAMEKVGSDLVYTDTDSLIYLRDETKPDPLAGKLGNWLGMLTSEIPEGWKMTKFVSPAAKVYSYQLKNEAGDVKYVTKAKGVTLDNCTASVINFNSLEELVRNKVINKNILQLTTTSALIRRELGKISTVESSKKTQVVMDKVRFLSDFTTLPYGYEKNND